MKASTLKPLADREAGRSEWLHGAAAVVVGAALAYGGLHLFAWLRPGDAMVAKEDVAPLKQPGAQPASMPAPHQPAAASPPANEDPWWRGDAAFWQEQARLNAAAVAPQYREIQIIWAQTMAATAQLRAQQATQSGTPLAQPAKQAQTSELTIVDDKQR